VTGEDIRPQWDFFVSYTQADREWAEWIAWVLEDRGYQVLIQAWDFVPGSNWIERMQAATHDATRTIAVLSEAYLASAYAMAEWRAAWASDPDGTRRKLLIIRIAPCERPGLLAGVVGVDLFGVPEEIARNRLQNMISAATSGRAKPAAAPEFPGSGRVMPSEPPFPGRPQTDEAKHGYRATGSSIYTRDAKSSARRPEATRRSAILHRPVVIATVLSAMVIGLVSASTVFRLPSTSVRWSYGRGSGTSSPVVADGMVYVGSWDHNLYALSVRP
jgi:hypothetical protein